MKNKWIDMVSFLAIVACVTMVLAACGSATPQATAQPQATSQPQAPVQPSATVKPASTAPASDGAALLEARCTICHSLDRIKQAKKTRDQWGQTVTRMVGKGAQLSTSEQSVLLDYLAKTYGP